jgi:hypothetical protein
MKDTNKAVEVYEPGKLRVVNGQSLNLEQVKSRFGWRHVESVTPKDMQN